VRNSDEREGALLKSSDGGDESMEPMHSLLTRQIRRYLGGVDSFPKAWQGFVDAVNQAYVAFDADRGLLERSVAAPSVSWARSLVLGALTLALVWLGVYPAPLIDMVQRAVARLL